MDCDVWQCDNKINVMKLKKISFLKHAWVFTALLIL